MGFLLAYVSVKLDRKFPYLIRSRIMAAKRIAEREGYQVDRADLESVCEELMEYDELRNFMAQCAE